MGRLVRPVSEINRLKGTLPKLTEENKREAFEKVANHAFIHSSDGINHCLMCGHQWKGKGQETTICPQCQRTLKLLKTRKRNFKESVYVVMMNQKNGFQIEREFKVELTQYRYGEPKFWIHEAYQRWMKEGYKDTIVSLAGGMASYYTDSWLWGSDFKIREERHQHTWIPFATIGKPEVPEILKRNGFDDDFHGLYPKTVLNRLVNDNKYETLWKLGMFQVLGYNSYRQSSFNEHFKQLIIANRNKYEIKDIGLWYDMLDNLRELGKDTNNPKYICPENLKEAHDHWRAKVDIKRKKEEYQRNLENAKLEEEAYQASKGKFLGLIFSDSQIKVVPLQSVKEFVEEGKNQHHCVYTNRYYKKENCLIFHALVENESIATIEFNLDTMRIVQCRGKCNTVPKHKSKIEKLIMKNVRQIEKCKVA